MTHAVVSLQSEATDFEAVVEVSQSLRGNMQREARLGYKFEVSHRPADTAGAAHVLKYDTSAWQCAAMPFCAEVRSLLRMQVWFGTELLTKLQFAHVAARAWPVVVADGARIGAAL